MKQTAVQKSRNRFYQSRTPPPSRPSTLTQFRGLCNMIGSFEPQIFAPGCWQSKNMLSTFTSWQFLFRRLSNKDILPLMTLKLFWSAPLSTILISRRDAKTLPLSKRVAISRFGRRRSWIQYLISSSSSPRNGSKSLHQKRTGLSISKWDESLCPPFGVVLCYGFVCFLVFLGCWSSGSLSLLCLHMHSLDDSLFHTSRWHCPHGFAWHSTHGFALNHASHFVHYLCLFVLAHQNRTIAQSLAISVDGAKSPLQRSRSKKGFWAQKSQPEIADR